MDISHHFDEKNPGDNIAIDNSHTGVMMNRVRKVSPMPEENGRKYDNPTVEEALHYPILMLKVGGFYFENFRWTKSVLARILFDVLVMAMALAIVIRIIAGFMTNGDFSDKLMGRIVFAVANISNIVMYPVLIINTTRNLPRVLAKFSAFQAENGFATNVRKLKRRITGISIFSDILSIIFWQVRILYLALDSSMNRGLWSVAYCLFATQMDMCTISYPSLTHLQSLFCLFLCTYN